MIRALVALLLCIGGTASASPLNIGVPISEARIGIASTSSSRAPLAAWNGERFLVTWYSTERGAQALLVDADGNPLAQSPTGLPFNHVTAVFWRDGAWTIVGNDEWARISEDGALLDRTPHKLAISGSLRTAVWTGEALVALLEPAFSDFDTKRIVIFDASLQPIAEHTFVLSDVTEVRLASDGDTALLVMTRYQHPTSLMLFDNSGALLRQGTIGGNYVARAVARRGNDSGYVFLTRDAGWPPRAGFTAFSIDPLLRTDVLVRFGADKDLYDSADTLSWDGSAFTFLYFAEGEDEALIHVARFTAGAAILENEPVLPLRQWIPEISGIGSVGGDGATLFFYGTRASQSRFLQMRIGRDAATFAAAPDVALERGAFEQVGPAVATSATQALVVWRERVEPGQPYSVYAARVDSRGRVLDPRSIHLGTTTSGISVASNGTDFLVAWHELTGIRVVPVRADGTPGDKRTIARAGNEAPETGIVRVFSNGSDYLVAWSQPSQNHNRGYAVRVSADGVIDDGLPSVLGTAAMLNGATDGHDYFLIGSSNGRLVSGSDARILMQVTVPGDGSFAMWWNGTDYRSVQYDGFGFRLARVTPHGTATAIGENIQFPRLGAIPSLSFPTLCDMAGCTGLYPFVENGRTWLRELRVAEEDRSASMTPGKSVEIAPFVVDERYGATNIVEIVPFRLDGRTFGAFSRPAMEAPYGGIYRIFIVPMYEQARTRAVRH